MDKIPVVEIKQTPQILAVFMVALFACIVGSALILAGSQYGPKSDATAQTRIMATSTAMAFEPTRQVLQNDHIATVNQIDQNAKKEKSNALVFTVWALAGSVGLAAASVALAVAARSIRFSVAQITTARELIQMSLYGPDQPRLPQPDPPNVLVLPENLENQNQTNHILEIKQHENQTH